MKHFLHDLYQFLKNKNNSYSLIQQYQLELRNGELVKLNGYQELNNKIQNSKSLWWIIMDTLIQTYLECALYYTVNLVCMIILLTDEEFVKDSSVLYWYILSLYLQYLCANLSVEFYNKWKLCQIDKKVNHQLAKILKQWDECIYNKEILRIVQKKAMQTAKYEEQSGPHSLKNHTHSLNNQQSNQIFSRQLSRSIPMQDVQNQSQGMISRVTHKSHLKKQISRQSIMSPLIKEDMILKHKYIQEMEKDPYIQNFKAAIPSLFEAKQVRPRTNTLIEKQVYQSQDKIDLVKIVDGQEVKLGDLIILERNQVACCDILILFSNDSSFSVQQQLVDYESHNIRNSLFKNRYDSQDLSSMKKNLTGTIHLSNLGDKLGYLQLKKDPQQKLIHKENMIYRSEKLLGTPWIIGVAIKLGRECHFFQNRKVDKPHSYKTHWFYTIHILTAFMLILILILLSTNTELQRHRSIILLTLEVAMNILISLPYFFYIVYKIFGIFQLEMMNFIQSIDAHQVKSFNLDKIHYKSIVSCDVDSYVESNVQINSLIYAGKYCEFQEPEFSSEITNYFSKLVPNLDIESEKESSPDNTPVYYEDERVPPLPTTQRGRFIHTSTSQDQLEILQVESQQVVPILKFDSQPENPLQQLGLKNKKFSSVSSMRESRATRKNLTITQFLDEVLSVQEKVCPLRLQLALNHITFSKLFTTQTGQEKIRNIQLNMLDQKQIQLGKQLQYEFICFNNSIHNEGYVIQIKDRMFQFKLLDVQIDTKRQRLMMLFEVPIELRNNDQMPFILFVRETNVQKKDLLEEKNGKTAQYLLENEAFHQVHYSYSELTQEECDLYLDQVSFDAEQQLYQFVEPLLKVNLIFGLKYSIKTSGKEFIQRVMDSHFQILLYTNSHIIHSQTICQQLDILNNNFQILHFTQNTEEDIRAYLKKQLQELQHIFYQTLHLKIVSQFNNSNNNKSPLNTKNVSLNSIDQQKPLAIILNSETLQKIMQNQYLRNHMKLLIQYTKVVLLYQATQQTVDEAQDLYEDSQGFINIIYENQSEIQCNRGMQIQIAQLQKFSFFRNLKLDRFSRSTFFINLIKSLKLQLHFQKSEINEVLIEKHSSLVVNSYQELEEIFFFYTPIFAQLVRQLFMMLLERSIFIFTLIFTLSIASILINYDIKPVIVEIIFVQYVYVAILSICHVFYYLTEIRKICQQQKEVEYLNFIRRVQQQATIKVFLVLKSILKALFFGIILGLSDIGEYSFVAILVLTINDILTVAIDLNLVFIAFGTVSLILGFIIYLLSVTSQEIIMLNYLFASLKIDSWFILLFLVLFLFFTELISNMMFTYKYQGDLIQKEDLSMSKRYKIAKPAKSPTLIRRRARVKYLQKQVNKIFDNIDNVDITIQKVLNLTKKSVKNTFGTWNSPTFNKAQSIFRWTKKSLFQTLKMIIFQNSLILMMYLNLDLESYYLLLYICSILLYIVIQIIMKIKERDQTILQQCEMAKYFISSASIAAILIFFGFDQNEESYLDNAAILLIYFQSSKFHPIYNYKIYLIPQVTNLIIVIIVFLIKQQLSAEYIIPLIILFIVFGIQQYIMKSFYTQLEEDQADNQLNFIVENDKINDILGILLPKFVRNRLNETDQYNIHQNQGNVAIVFCDICEFDQIIMEEQNNIIKFVDIIFRKFDQFCSQCGVQKIETVGKTYMAAAGLKACEQDLLYLSQVDPVQRALNLAELMIGFIRTITWGDKENKLIGKIGIHYGNAISGVIGFHKPQFSLIGNTVNTTSRVCSTGLDDNIILSEQAFDQLKNDQIDFQVRYVEMKGLGQRPTYLLQQTNKKKTTISNKNESSNNIRKNFIRKNSNQQHTIFKKRTIIQRKSERNPTKLSMFRQGSMLAVQTPRGNSHQFEDQHSSYSGSVSIQIPKSKQVSQDNFGFSNNLLSLTRNIQQNIDGKFEIEAFQPEVDRQIDYQQLLVYYYINQYQNVLLIKSENNVDQYIITNKSFLDLVKMSYYQIGFDHYQEFIQNIITQSSITNGKYFQLFFVYYLIKQFSYISLYQQISPTIIVLSWMCCLLNFICMAIIRKQYSILQVKFIIASMIFEIIVAALYIPFCQLYFIKQFHVFEIIFITKIFCKLQLIQYWLRLILSPLVCILLMIMIPTYLDDYLASLLFSIMSTSYTIIFTYYLEEQQVKCFNQKKIYEAQQVKEQQLIQYLLPKHILNSFFSDNLRTNLQSDHIENLTILFADIAGFTEYSSKVTPEQVLQMLKNLFVEFDRKCFDLNVYKLYTIGDCYVVIGMIDYDDRNPAQEAKNVVELAFEMIKIIEQVRKQINFDGLDMRIGIHTGSVFGGVMGTDIVRYDIYGPDVLIANKMESNGSKGLVQVSKSTKELLESEYEDLYGFELHTTINLQVIQRNIDGYFIYKEEQDKFDQEIQMLSQGDMHANLTPSKND